MTEAAGIDAWPLAAGSEFESDGGDGFEEADTDWTVKDAAGGSEGIKYVSVGDGYFVSSTSNEGAAYRMSE